MFLKQNKPDLMMNKGFTLVEVLVTVVIMAIGLLGLAGLQISALRNNLSAEQSGKAVQLAYDMADRMRSNKDDSGLGATSKYAVIDPVNAINFGCDASAPCSPANLAQTDLFQWANDVSSSLPGGTPGISVSGAVFTVIVNWDDNRDGNTDASDAAVVVSFQP